LGEYCVAVSVHGFQELLQVFRPDVLVDARMRKRKTPERQLGRCQEVRGMI
jgi:hypothetical protein